MFTVLSDSWNSTNCLTASWHRGDGPCSQLMSLDFLAWLHPPHESPFPILRIDGFLACAERRGARPQTTPYASIPSPLAKPKSVRVVCCVCCARVCAILVAVSLGPLPVSLLASQSVAPHIRIPIVRLASSSRCRPATLLCGPQSDPRSSPSPNLAHGNNSKIRPRLPFANPTRPPARKQRPEPQNLPSSLLLPLFLRSLTLRILLLAAVILLREGKRRYRVAGTQTRSHRWKDAPSSRFRLPGPASTPALPKLASPLHSTFRPSFHSPAALGPA